MPDFLINSFFPFLFWVVRILTLERPPNSSAEACGELFVRPFSIDCSSTQPHDIGEHVYRAETISAREALIPPTFEWDVNERSQPP